MSARQLHAVVAAGLHDPQLLARWQGDAGALRAFGPSAEALDVEAVSQFAGFTFKVRHNGLRSDYPLTFRLLGAAGLEARLFTDYALHCASGGHALAPSPLQRGEELAAFVANWIEPARPAEAMLGAVIRHELALARLRARPPAPPASPAAVPKRLRLADIPSIAGDMELAELAYDPDLLASALNRPAPALDSVPAAATGLGYWRTPDGAGRVVRLDDFTFGFLGLVDGERSLRQIGAALALPSHLSILPAARRIAEAGLIRIGA